ncbi:MAG: 3-dehydroquinate synthase [Spirochaetaceae bacterium]|jgi:3-dehydroquinate synthase|nr:3-dehydroquinate synthase [Spirochaetaceae bacterium]
MNYHFKFKDRESTVRIIQNIPTREEILSSFEEISSDNTPVLFVCDCHTKHIAERIRDGKGPPLCILEAGEKAKNLQSLEIILNAAKNAGFARDSLFIAVGGGVITDMTGFAASIYMRGAKLSFVSTTLLGMADAAVGGKTGIDYFERKNLAGTFYPAHSVYMPISVLRSLPPEQLKSGFAEIVKTLILDKESDDLSWEELKPLKDLLENGFENRTGSEKPNSASETQEQILERLVSVSVKIKGRIVEADPEETGEQRALLNLGHSFAHALESSAGLGVLSHGEAVAWGIVQSCVLGRILGITPESRARKISSLIKDLGYQSMAPHPAMQSIDAFMTALLDDKKKKNGVLRFIIPAERGAVLIRLDNKQIGLIQDIAAGACA